MELISCYHRPIKYGGMKIVSKSRLEAFSDGVFGTEQGNTFFQGRDGLLFFIARRAIVDGVNKKCYNY